MKVRARISIEQIRIGSGENEILLTVFFKHKLGKLKDY